MNKPRLRTALAAALLAVTVTGTSVAAGTAANAAPAPSARSAAAAAPGGSRDHDSRQSSSRSLSSASTLSRPTKYQPACEGRATPRACGSQCARNSSGIAEVSTTPTFLPAFVLWSLSSAVRTRLVTVFDTQ